MSQDTENMNHKRKIDKLSIIKIKNICFLKGTVKKIKSQGHVGNSVG